MRDESDSLGGVSLIVVTSKIILKLHVTKLAREPGMPGDMWLLQLG